MFNNSRIHHRATYLAAPLCQPAQQAQAKSATTTLRRPRIQWYDNRKDNQDVAYMLQRVLSGLYHEDQYSACEEIRRRLRQLHSTRNF